MYLSHLERLEQALEPKKPLRKLGVWNSIETEELHEMKEL